ncbi:hypothetical protein A4D02_32510 [Niastella koreensis]|uniref:Uncharacterized protein n=2 Tax=Niastella koreensis TaxID=354356 RepID=G8T7B8_NIAKG|nr:hypothetical protein [Niastella koreensis]AEW01154.1 hypothetical protein Niako_4914 [Niastella koreensis GR20-10]OQP45922.1 hypothetical protein A4D02_32510 [Niastella koreensis]
MKRNKVFLYSLAIQVALSQLLLFIFVPDADLFSCIKAILVTCALWALGLFFGVTFSIIVRKPNIETWLYICGQLLVYTLLSAYISINQDDFKKHGGILKPEWHLIPDSRREKKEEIDTFLDSIPDLPDALKQQIRDSIFKDK